MQARRARFWEEAVDRARVLVRREDEGKLRQEALAALEEQSQKEPRTQQ